MQWKSPKVSAVLAGNSAIKTAFGASPEFWALGELGGRDSSAAGTQTVNSSIDLSVDLTQSVKQNLLVGLYNPVVTGAAVGVTDVVLGVYANGSQIENLDLGNGTAAKAALTDDVLNLGSLSSAPFGGSTLDLKITLGVTTNTVSSGFDVGLLIGNPPSGSSSAGLLNLVSAMAGFGGSAAGSSTGSSSGTLTPDPNQVLAPSALHA
jgi:hypothetical protein